MILAELMALNEAKKVTLAGIYKQLEKMFELDSDNPSDRARLKGLSMNSSGTEIQIHVESHRTEVDFIGKVTMKDGSVQLGGLGGGNTSWKIGPADDNEDLAGNVLGHMESLAEEDDDEHEDYFTGDEDKDDKDHQYDGR